MLQGKPVIAMMGLLALGVSAAADTRATTGLSIRIPDETATTGLSLRISDETAPAGGMVQMKVRTYEVTPISGGRPLFSFDPALFDGVAGVGMFAPTGELAGAAVVDGNHVAIAYVTTTPFTGDYPLLTVALRIRQDLAVGSRTLFTLDPSSLWNLNGAMLRTTVSGTMVGTAVSGTVAGTRRVSPATVTVGGSVAITNVIPGEGWFPAGTVVSVRGLGFNSDSRLRVDTAITAVRVVSSTEIQFTLAQAANMTAARLRVVNPNTSTNTYYSYMRGIPAATSGRTLLSTTQPIFSGTTRSLATFGPIPALNGTQYAALALQNPNLASANVTIELYAADGTLLHSSSRSLENGYRLSLELSELFDGVAPPPDASVRVTSSLPIEVFGLLCDEGTWTVTPRLPTEAK
jgi:hypothetical protein